MISPAQAAIRFGWALVLGGALGAVYGFLRPLRRRRSWPADLVFAFILWGTWIYLCFGICRGDIRMAYTFGLAAGCFLWEQTAGKLLRPVFRRFWERIFRLFRWIGYPFIKILKNFL